jgi:uncharacterized protein YecE (DUF72 family)
MAGRLYLGTSGWSYDAWRSNFYAGVTRGHWLSHYATCFNAVEINATFYRRPAASTLERWHDDTPAQFRFAVKASRFLTHVKRLLVAGENVAREREAQTS